MAKLDEYKILCDFLRYHLRDNIYAIEKNEFPTEYFNRYFQGMKSAYIEILLLLESLENQEDSKIVL